MNEIENKFVAEVIEDLERDGHRLLYLVRFGSHLYGTNGPNSDIDLKGIFLPSKESCVLCEAPKHYTRTTGQRDSKNSTDDIDIQMWSLQYFLQLVKKGETNAIDLLYSHTHPDMIVFDSGELNRMFRDHQRTFTAKKCNSYVGYAIGQAKKYGVKGSRMGVMKRVFQYLDSLPEGDYRDDHSLSDIVTDLLIWHEDESYCFRKNLKSSNGSTRPYLVLCGAKHDFTISLREFTTRVKKTYDTYGDRAKAAEENQGIDWKALSHAVRSLDQMKELLQTGKINYPLSTREKLKRIKFGEYTWKDVEKMINDGLDSIDRMVESFPEMHQLDSEFVKDLVTALY